MSKLQCNVLKISGGGKCPKCPPLVARLGYDFQDPVSGLGLTRNFFLEINIFSMQHSRRPNLLQDLQPRYFIETFEKRTLAASNRTINSDMTNVFSHLLLHFMLLDLKRSLFIAS